MSPRASLLSALACATAIVCGCSTADRTTVVVRDSAGIQIVENVAPDSANATWWQLSPAPDIDIGAVEGSDAETLYRVTDTKRLSDGRLVVANSGSSQIRFYGVDGVLDTIAGKAGAGPGEFQRITELAVIAGDSVVVSDPAARRFTMLDPQGRFVRNFGAGGVLNSLLGAGPDGSWIGALPVRLGSAPPASGTIRGDLVYGVVSADGSAVTDTIARFPGSERHLSVRQSGGQITSIEIRAGPFDRNSTVRLGGDGLLVGTQDAPELREYGVDGNLRRIIRTGSAPVPVTQEHIDRVIERGVANLPDEQAKAVRQSMTELATANELPPYGTFLIDRSGNLWLQDHPALQDKQRWTVFDAQGALIARIALPDRFTPFDIGSDWIAGKELDESDVEHVRVYVVIKPN